MEAEELETDEEEYVPVLDHCQYPPTGQKLENMVLYLRRRKLIPVDIPHQVVNEADVLSISMLTPTEIHCLICPSNPALDDPLLITDCGTIVSLQGVKRSLS